MIAYNQERFIRDAVLGALAQTYSPLEIILSDDCSTDRTFAIIEELARGYAGPHQIILNRNAINEGLAPHINRAMRMASGELIVTAAGDDVSLPARVQRSWELMNGRPEIACLSFAVRKISDTHQSFDQQRRFIVATQADGVSPGVKTFSLEDYMRSWSLPMKGCSRTYRRSIMEIFGGLSDKCPTEDSTLRLRCLLAGRIAYSAEEQVLYRIHGANMSATQSIHHLSQKRIYRQYLRDVRTACRVGLLAADRVEAVKSRLRQQTTRAILMHGARGGHGVRTFGRLLFSEAYDRREKLELARGFLRMVARKILAHGPLASGRCSKAETHAESTGCKAGKTMRTRV